MRKEFNVTGSCNPQRHYMVDTEKRFKAVENLIDRGNYFTINRARQYGKTTMLNKIWFRLSDKYLVIPLSFEGLGDEAFASPATFVTTFKRQMTRHLVSLRQNEALIGIWQNGDASSIDDLSEIVTDFCRACPKPVVVTIDEVDKSSDNQLFLNFLGMLRNKYLERDKEGMNYTFHSVILAGVYDIKNLKLKLRPDAEKKYNSPWNIAADFNVDMTFHPEEIAQMLNDYENDVHSGMDIKAISEEIYKYTTGYPYLVIQKLTDTEEIYKKLKENNCKIILQAFIDADKQLENVEFNTSESGTTCCLIIHIGNHILCANTGDSRAIVTFDESNESKKLKNLQCVPLSIDYKPDLPEEANRIIMSGGEIEQMTDEFGKGVGPLRVWVKGGDYPGLAMSRSIGDLKGKTVGIIPDPGIFEYDLNKTTKFIIVCSDGIWEYLTNEKVKDIGKKFYLENNASAFCHTLVSQAFIEWERHDNFVDDITAVVAFF